MSARAIQCPHLSVFVIVISSFQGYLIAGDNPPASARSLAALYEQHLERRARLYFRAEQELSVQVSNSAVQKQTSEGNFRRHHDNYHVTLRRQVLPWGLTPAAGRTTHVTVSSVAFVFDTLGSNSPAFLTEITELGEARARARALLGNAVSSDLGGLAEDGTLTIPAILTSARNLTVRPSAEIVDGLSTWVLHAESDNGSYTLWLDAAEGYAPRRLLATKTVGCAMNGGGLSNTSTSDQAVVPGTRNAVLYEIDTRHRSFVQLGSARIPQESTVVTTIILDDGEKIVYRERLLRFDISLPRVGAETDEFLPDAADGTPVQLWEPGTMAGIVREWRS